MGRLLEPEVMEGADEAAAYDEFDAVWGDVILQGFAESAVQMGVREGRVLDVGTGPGRVAIRLAKLNPRLVVEGIDLSEAMLDRARANARKGGAGSVRFSVGDAKRIPFADGTFDLVVSHNFLHQLPDPGVALREIVRVARPAGAIAVRDVRRLPEPLMTLVMPLWCLGYSDRLRRQTIASFRAALSRAELTTLVETVGIEHAVIRTNGFTHQTVERLAVPYEPAPGGVVRPNYSVMVRMLKSMYVSVPRVPGKGERVD
jgi:ubiquinone/menaquinone biosynthesis C-methylase UbiE